MALTASSVLHYWSARYGPIPIIGGKPVHSRSSAGSILDQRGTLYRPIINTPRFGWDTIAGDRRQTMRLEMARTNPTTYSDNWTNAAWVKDNATVTYGALAPDGTATASTMTATATNGQVYQSPGPSTSIVRTASVWIRRKTGSGVVQLYSPLASGPVDVAVTSNWQRFAVTGPAGTERYVLVRCTVSGDAVDVWRGQVEDAASPSSEIPTTTAAATRATDSFYWDYNHAPQAMAAYVRFVERGTVGLATAGRVFQISNAADATPHLIVYQAGGVYRAYWDTGVGGNVSSVLAAAPAVGDTVELAIQLASDGKVTINQSINAAAITSGAASAARALPTAFGGTRLQLNSDGPLAAVGINDFAELKIVKLPDMAATTAATQMTELRAFELSPAGEVLA